LRFIEDCFPLLVTVGPKRWDPGEIEQMTHGFERYFVRGDRYATLFVSPKGADAVGAKERKLIVDYANNPRVKEYSKKLCVASATVIENTLMRGTLTAIQWFWTPAAPFKAVASVEAGLHYCLDELDRARIPLPRSAAALQLELLKQLKDL
jgi:hypothetical protein